LPVRASRPVRKAVLLRVRTLLCLTLCLLPSLSFIRPMTTASAALAKPDIIFILTDDQRWDTMQYMPRTNALLPVRYANAFVSSPECCPSRSTILTGLYSHDSGVWTNDPDHFGGWPAFQSWEQNGGISIASALHGDGYHTGLFGKFLNGWDGTVPNGWDEFAGRARIPGPKGPDRPYYNYTLAGIHEGQAYVQSYGSGASDYSTTVLKRKAEQFISSAPSDSPMFLYYAPNAPHSSGEGGTPGPPIPAPRDIDSPVSLPPLDPDVNEADVSDKPNYIKALEPIDVPFLQHWRTEVARSLLAVDRSVKQIVAAQEVRDPGLLNTIIIFTSDNGHNTGAHRWLGKGVPYEEAIRVPMRAYLPGQPTQTVSGLVNNLDIAPTIADAAGIPFHTNGDGRSLLSSRTRYDFVIEGGVGSPHAFCGIRSAERMYVKYKTGEVEFYNLNRDPYELQNLPDAAAVPKFYALANQQCSPLPPGWPRPTL
jgi:N-acetylglucosamine-6-sulfatase